MIPEGYAKTACELADDFKLIELPKGAKYKIKIREAGIPEIFIKLSNGRIERRWLEIVEFAEGEVENPSGKMAPLAKVVKPGDLREVNQSGRFGCGPRPYIGNECIRRTS